MDNIRYRNKNKYKTVQNLNTTVQENRMKQYKTQNSVKNGTIQCKSQLKMMQRVSAGVQNVNRLWFDVVTTDFCEQTLYNCQSMFDHFNRFLKVSFVQNGRKGEIKDANMLYYIVEKISNIRSRVR